MEIQDILGQYFNLGATTDIVFTILWIIFLLIVVGVIGYYVFFLGQFKIKFRVKYLSNNRKIILDTKAREFKDHDGVMYWQLLLKHEKIPVPPDECIEIDAKGKRCVEAYKISTGEYVYLRDNGDLVDANLKKVPLDILNEPDAKIKKAKMETWRTENVNAISPFQPLTTNQRVILAHQIRVAQEKKNKRWQDYILPVAGISALVILVVSLMIFYEDMGKPLLSMADKQNTYAQIQNEQLKLLREIQQDIQVIRSEDIGSGGKPPN